MMDGYKTVITMGIAFIAAILQLFGVLLPEDEQAAIVTAIIAIAAIILRFKTKGPIFNRKK